ncbi:hypothetical protein Q5530_36180 [Saccharothrix sp. BKS2]|uniref:hypothetical protein n=1 Tax=Saccharothrix sp. BKS2 TaxID=3064400 RepID=UPI0039EBF069
MDEPVFRPLRRFGWWWFVPPALVALVGVLALVASGTWAGPFRNVTEVRAMLASKREFFQDPEVKRILLAHGLRVHVTPVGSFDLAEKEDLDSYDFVFPSGQTANERVKERRAGKHTVPYRPFFSPVVLSTYRDYAEALVRAGAAVPQQDGGELYYDLSVETLMGLIDDKKLWTDFGVDTQNRIIVQTPDPCRTYSGAVYVGFVAFAAQRDTPKSETDAIALAQRIKPYFTVEGQHLEDMAPKYFSPEGRTFAPIAVIYEHQFIAYQAASAQPDRDRVLLYPRTAHQSVPELISFGALGDRIGELLMHDADLRKRAVELGFRLLGAGGKPEEDFDAFVSGRGLPVPRLSDTRAYLPAVPLFELMRKEVGNCA